MFIDHRAWLSFQPRQGRHDPSYSNPHWCQTMPPLTGLATTHDVGYKHVTPHGVEPGDFPGMLGLPVVSFAHED